MTGKREAKKEELRERLINAASLLIEEHGVRGLRARDIAEKAGCALGGLYTVFSDLDMLILNVHSRTLLRMEDELRQAAPLEAGPREAFRQLALAYLRFAQQNRKLWTALFEHSLPDGAATPQWHIEQQAFLIELIARPLSQAMPDATAETIAARARTLFAAVHGVVWISLEDRFTGIASGKLEQEVGTLADILAEGIAAIRDRG